MARLLYNEYTDAKQNIMSKRHKERSELSSLRGKVIPVVALRLKFGMQETDYTERTCIIVVEIAGEA